MKDITQWRLYRKSWLAAERKITTVDGATVYLEHRKHHIHRDDLYIWQNRPTMGRDAIYWFAQCTLCGYRHSIRRVEVPQRLTENRKRSVDWEAANRLREKHAAKTSAAFNLVRIDYLTYLESDVWQGKRQEAFASYGEYCQICLEKKATQIHHLTYANLGHEEMEDVMPLCWQCHKFVHDTESKVFRNDKDVFIFYRGLGGRFAPINTAEWLSLAEIDMKHRDIETQRRRSAP